MAHEDLARQQAVEASSDRSFGVVMAVAFGLIGLWPLLGSSGVRLWALGLAAAFLAAALLLPRSLAALNRAWVRLGVLLGRIVSPLALGLVFYLVVTPIALAMRLSSQDPLRLRRDPQATSHWRPRQPPGPPPRSLDKQF